MKLIPFVTYNLFYQDKNVVAKFVGTRYEFGVVWLVFSHEGKEMEFTQQQLDAIGVSIKPLEKTENRF